MVGFKNKLLNNIFNLKLNINVKLITLKTVIKNIIIFKIFKARKNVNNRTPIYNLII